MKPGQPPGIYGEAMKAKRNGFLPSALIDRDVSPPRAEGAGGFVPAVMFLRECATIDGDYCLTKDCLSQVQPSRARDHPLHINTSSRRALR